LEFTRKVELDSNIFQFQTVFNVSVVEVISLTLKEFQVPVGGLEDYDDDIEINVCVKLELRLSVCLGVTNKGIRGTRANPHTFLNLENKSR
jgi:hypothetical protein